MLRETWLKATQYICSRLCKYMEKDMSFNIQGSLAIRVEDGKINFLLYPANAYLSPDKSSAVLYPVMTKTQENQAKLLKLIDGYLELDYVASADANTELKSLLSQIAFQNKTVALTINEKNGITGFTYPAPRV